MLRRFSRRQLLQSGLFLGAAVRLSPRTFLRTVLAGPSAAPKNVVLLELYGGNDGLNTLVPFGVNGGTYYSEFRKKIAIPESSLLKIAGNDQVGFNPALAALKTHFDAGRLAVVQGVSYPNPSFSHDTAQLIWAKGDPTAMAGAGWLARYVELHPTDFPSAAALFDHLTPELAGSTQLVPAIESVEEFTFPFDDEHSDDAENRLKAYGSIVTPKAGAGGKLGALSSTSKKILDLIDAFASIPPYVPAGIYPEESHLGEALQLAAHLFSSGLGIRFVHLGAGGYDTHSQQEKDGYHDGLLQDLSEGLSAFHADLAALGLADDTLVVVYSEFGRTVYENGSLGCDHGTVVPVLVLGNAVTGGLVTPHPAMDPDHLTADGELAMTADFRDVFGTIVSKWLGESPAAIFPGFAASDLGFLG